MTTTTARRELILYAVPTGAFAAACDDYFARAGLLGSTEAQRYPPHCTLTGFFRRTDRRSDEVIAEVRCRLDGFGPVPNGAVAVRGPAVRYGWFGFELDSPWLISATAAVVDADRLGPDDDAMRRKTWLHLSLAYGVDGLESYRALADECFGSALAARGGASDADVIAGAGWRVGLWERTADGSWIRH